jgi:hypothetical protein
MKQDTLDPWHRIGREFAYFVISTRGENREPRGIMCHFQVRTHPIGSDRKKLYFALCQEHAQSFMAILTGESEQTEIEVPLRRDRGFLRLCILPNGERRITFVIRPSSPAHPGCEGEVTGEYYLSFLKPKRRGDAGNAG